MPDQSGECAAFTAFVAGLAQEGAGGGFPIAAVTANASVRAPTIMPGIAQAIGLTLAMAAHAMRDTVATRADAGRAAHWRRP